MIEIVRFLSFRTWWQYDPAADWYALPYHWTNLIEGCFWVGFAVLVFVRYARHKHSAIELVYVLAFLTFGVSDFREAYVVQSWLILFKGTNLAALLYLRWLVIKRFYPGAKVF